LISGRREAIATPSTMKASFKTARLLLSPVREADRENLVALERDPEVMRFLNGGQRNADDRAGDSAGFLTPRGGEDDVWAAVETRSGAFVGWFSLRHVDDGIGELGFRLRRAALGSRLGFRGRDRVGRHGIRGPGFGADFRHHHGGQHRLASGDGKDGLDPCPTVYPSWRNPLPGSELGEVEYEITRQGWEAKTLGRLAGPRG
jgi:hypothetical protein